jgi:hypothetical protein
MARLPRLSRAPRFAGSPRAETVGAPDDARARAARHEAPDAQERPPAGWAGGRAAWAAYRWLRSRGVPFHYGIQPGAATGTRPVFTVGDRSPGLILEVTEAGGFATAAETRATTLGRGLATSAGYGYARVTAASLLEDADAAMTTALGGQQPV